MQPIQRQSSMQRQLSISPAARLSMAQAQAQAQAQAEAEAEAEAAEAEAEKFAHLDSNPGRGLTQQSHWGLVRRQVQAASVVRALRVPPPPSSPPPAFVLQATLRSSPDYGAERPSAAARRVQFAFDDSRERLSIREHFAPGYTHRHLDDTNKSTLALLGLMDELLSHALEVSGQPELQTRAAINAGLAALEQLQQSPIGAVISDEDIAVMDRALRHLLSSEWYSELPDTATKEELLLFVEEAIEAAQTGLYFIDGKVPQ